MTKGTRLGAGGNLQTRSMREANAGRSGGQFPLYRTLGGLC